MKHTLSVLVENKPGALMRSSSMFARRTDRFSPSSANEMARMRFIRVNAVSDAAKKMESTKSTTTTARIAQSAPPI